MAGSKDLFGKFAVAQDKEWLTFVSHSSGTEDMVVKTLHVSCKSDKFDEKKGYIGFVLYKYLEQDEWMINNVRCKSGYIYFIESSKLDCVKVSDTYHARAFYNLFGVELVKDDVVGSGFAYLDGVWKENSTTFNYIETPWTDGAKTRKGVTEMEFLKKAIVTWTKEGCQNLETNKLKLGGQKFWGLTNLGFN